MRWFKHMADMRNDHFIKALRAEFGIEGYGAWCMLLEIFADECGQNPEQKLTFFTQVLRKELGVSHQKLTKILSFFSENSKLFWEISEKNIQIEIPKMALLKDNHTSNLQVACKQVSPNKNKEVEVEVEGEDKDPPISPQEKNELPDWLPEQKLNEFKKFRRDMKAPLNEQAQKLLITALTKLKNEGHDPLECLEQSIMNGWKSVFPIKGDYGKPQSGGQSSKPSAALGLWVDEIEVYKAGGGRWLFYEPYERLYDLGELNINRNPSMYEYVVMYQSRTPLDWDKLRVPTQDELERLEQEASVWEIAV